MRRLWAFLVMVVSLFLGVAFLSQPILDRANVSNEFDNGSQAVYKISIDENNAENSNKDLKKDFDIKKQFQTRLDTAGIRGASIDIAWPETTSDRATQAEVKVTFARKSSSELGLIRRIIEGNGALTISTKNTSKDEIKTGTAFFAEKPAAVAYDSSNKPYITLALKDDKVWKDMTDLASKQSETEEQKKLYIWRNFIAEGNDADTWEKAFSTDATKKDVLTADKVLWVLNTDSDYDSTNNVIKISTDHKWDYENSRSPWSYSGDSLDWTISTARAMVEAINADDYGYNVTYLYSNSTVAPVFGNKALIIAIVGFTVAFVLMYIFMIVRYGMAGVISLVSNVVTLFLTIFIAAFLGFEFSIAAICGLTVISILGAFINATYFDHVLSEFKKGRSVDKANKEGYKKAFNIIFDASAITFFSALFSFLIAKGLVKVLFGFVVIGAVLSFLLTNYLTKWMMYWLTTYARSASPRIVFGYHLAKEKPLYDVKADNEFISLENKERDEKIHKKNKKTLTIVSSLVGCLSLASAVLLGVFGGIYGGEEMFNNSGDFSSNYVLSIATSANKYNDQTNGNREVEIANNSVLVDYLKDVVIKDALSTYTPLNSETKFTSVDEFLTKLDISFDDYTFNIISVTNDSSDTEKTFSMIYADYKMKPLTGDAFEARDDAVQKVIIPGIIGKNSNSLASQSASRTNIAKSENFTSKVLKERYVSSAYTATSESGIVTFSLTWMFVTVSLIGLFASIYFTLRYGIASGLVELIVVSFAVLLATAVLMVFKVPFSSFGANGMMAGALVISFLPLPYLSRNKDVLKEVSLYKTATLSQREKASKVALRSSLGSILVGSIGGLIMSIVGVGIVGIDAIPVALGMGIVVLSGAVLMFTYVPSLFPLLRDHLSLSFLNGVTSKIKDNINKRKKHKKVIVADPNEAKETVIPGINDYRNF